MDSSRYGAPPPPPPPVMGSLPATRLQTQLPPEAPACVQNAMMTKDKKPFTYTPGGIDLSQIKSPRMAKRIARNANSEGFTGVPKVSPLAQPNTPGVLPPTPPCLPSGMPVQVFPTGPPQPPPPPPPQAKLIAPQNGINGNKSPERKSPQSFEPPPFGCRPEIKIPPNPMATLRPTPKPQPKDDFWVEEYRKERSKSPLAPQQSDGQSNNVEKYEEAPTTRAEVQKPQISQKPSSPVNVVPKRISPIRSPSPPTSRPQPQSPARTPQQETPLTIYNNVAPAKEESPIRIAVKSQNVANQRAPSPVRQTPPQSPPQRNAQLGSIYIPPVEDQMANRQHLLNQQTPPWMQSRHATQKETPEWVNRDEAPKVQQNQATTNSRERIIPIQLEQTPTPTKTPMTPGFGPQPFYNVAQQYSSVQSPPATYSSPTYTNPYNNPNHFVDQGYNNYANQAQNQAWSNGQQNAGQRIIPISIDGQSPENSFNVRGPVSQQPTMIRSDPRSPQNLPQPPWMQPNQSKSFRILQKMTDTIVDGNTSEEEAGPAELQQPHYSRPLGPSDMNENQLRKLQLTENDRALMNRVKNQVDQETYLHTEEDPRYRGAAIPSKAFKLLQNMTDGGQAYDNQVPLHRANPRFAQQRAMFQPNEGENQVYVHPSEQHVPEPKIYTGSAIPSRSFKILQAMTTPENAAEGTDASDIEDTNYSPLPYPPPYPYPYYDPHWQYYHPQSPMTVPPDGGAFWGGFYGPQGYGYYPYYGYPPFYGPPFVPISHPEEEMNQARKTPSLRRTPSIVVTPTPEDQLDDAWSDELKKNLSGSDKRYSGDDEKMTNEDSDDSDSSSTSSETGKSSQIPLSSSKSGLQAIKSVTDINVYDEGSETEEEEVTEEAQENEPEEISEVIMNDEMIPHQLSVILEESERSKRRPSYDDTESGSTFSDSDTTIACEDEEEPPQDEQIENMVTVRLPLKLSYSRSSNDEEITTVHVGNSETRRNSSDADISVTVSIPSRASSIDRGGLSKTPSMERRNSSGFEFEESDSEVSVSVSLPMKRDKFFGETQKSGTCNDISVDNTKEEAPKENGQIEDETEYEYVTESEDEIMIEVDVKDKSPMETIQSESETTEYEYEEVTETEYEEESQTVPKEEKKLEVKNYEDESSEEETEYETEYISESEGEIIRKVTYVREAIIYHNFVNPKWFPLEITTVEEPQFACISYIKEDTPEIQLKRAETPEKIEEDEQDDEPDEESDDDDEETSEEESSEDDDQTEEHLQVADTIPKALQPETETIPKTLPSSEAEDEEAKVSVKDRIAVFENVATTPAKPPARDIRRLANSSHRSSIEESADDDDSGVTSDISRPLSDTESENFPELKKMSRYQRAATHSRLFKLLQDECDDDKPEVEEEKPAPKTYKPKKIVHNVSITRRNNPNAASEVETMEERRKRLSLPLEKSSSTDQESMSSSVSSTSPTSSGVNEKLVSELVQSLLMQKRGRTLRNVPIEKLHAAAKRVLLEDLDIDSVMGSSQEDTTVDSTPALTPQEFTYPDYYDSWNDADERFTYDIVPSRAFRCLQEQSLTGQRKSWAARCPRVLSSKTVNRDLSRVAEIRESESPETTPPSTSSRSTPYMSSPTPTCDLKPGRSRTPMSEDASVH